MRSCLCIVALLLMGCGESVTPACGEDMESREPVMATGLSGMLDGTQPAVEVVRLDPQTCEETRRVWMLFEDPGAMVTLGPEPDGILQRGEVEVTDESIFFPPANVGVRLEYPDGVIAPELDLVWFSVGEDLRTVRCDATPFACELVD